MRTMLALVGVGDEHPTERLVGHGRLAALERTGTDGADAALDQSAARLRGAVRVIHARLPPVVVGLVGDVENQEASDGRLARCHPQGLVVVGGLHTLGYRL